MNKKKIFFILFILVLIIFIIFIFFYKKTAKVFKIGNNMTSQEIVEYILNISSYETKVEVQIESNKNSSKYIINQRYQSPNFNSQEIIEPSNIKGVKITREGDNLRIENSNLNLSSLFENYNYISSNCLDLSSFIEDYKNSDNSEYIEEENQIIMKTQNSNNKYRMYKNLYIDKQTHNPVKLEIKDNNQKSVVYILYNEVKINSVNKDNILAFELYNVVSNI